MFCFFYFLFVKMLLLVYMCLIKLVLRCFFGVNDGFMLFCLYIFGECFFDYWYVFVKLLWIGNRGCGYGISLS